MADSGTKRPVALVTGASRRIGREIALGLAVRGYDVAIHTHNSAGEAREVIGRIEALGRRAVAVVADFGNLAEVEHMVPRTIDLLGAPVCLVNNASEFRDDTMASLNGATWDAHHNVNLRAPVFLAQALALHLPEGAAGNVINIIDQRVLRPAPDFFSYALSKAGLWAATRTMAQALAPRVRVNAIGPGPVLQSVHQTEAEFAAECAATLLKRGSSPAEIAAAVGFILDAPAMTGQLIVLDAGQHLA